MNFIFCFLLITLGGLSAQDFLSQKVKPLGNIFAKLQPYAEYIGFSGILLGFIWVINALRLVLHIGSYPILLLLLVWLTSALTLGLGLILGFDIMRKIVGEPPSSFMLKIMQWREGLIQYRKELGLAGIGLGVFFLLYMAI